MSQIEILIIMKELGGICSSKQIKEIAKKKFPETFFMAVYRNTISKNEKAGNCNKR